MAGKGKGTGKGSREGRGGEDYRKMTSLQEMILKEAARTVTIHQDGRSETISMEEVVTRKLFQTAAKGGQHAISNTVHLVIEAQRLTRERIERDVAFGLRLKASLQAQHDQVRARGGDLDTILPHPDDIIIDYGAGYRIVGPCDADELKAVRKDCAWRDVVLLQAALEERLGPVACDDGGRPSEHPADTTALFLVHLFNRCLPQRFQKSGLELTMDLMRHGRLTRRELLKTVHRSWARLGKPKPRGWRLPPFEWILRLQEQVIPALMAVHAEIRSGRLTSDHVIEEKPQRILMAARAA